MPDYVSIVTQCPICGETDTINLTYDEYANYLRWQRGMLLIQDALPNRTANEREQLKTGICGKCWSDMFGGDEND